MRIGFIGLGAMGLPMTRNLIGAGHEVTVASRSSDSVARGVAAGAVDGGDPSGVASASDLVMICVPGSREVIDVLDAMLPVLGAGKTVVDCSTIAPDVERAQHERVAATSARYLEAPLSGGTEGAQNGALTMIVGGDVATLDSIRPVLRALATTIIHCGAPGTGQVLKLCNNLVYAAQMVALAEATALALKSEADPRDLYAVLTHSSGDCYAVRTRLPVPGVRSDTPASNGWRPGFTTDLMNKDVGLAIDHGGLVGAPLRVTEVTRQLLCEASAAGYGKEDFSALAKVVLQAKAE